MKISLIAAQSKNKVIGNADKIPWSARGEQLIFQALTFEQYVLVGRKTYETVKHLGWRNFIVLSRNPLLHDKDCYGSVEDALYYLKDVTDHVLVAGGGQIYHQTMPLADTIHLSTIDTIVEGDTYFPDLPDDFSLVFEQEFKSNIDYTYQIWKRNEKNV